MTNCEKLQKEIDKALEGLFEKEKKFMSHLTIVRARKIGNKDKFLDELSKIKVKNTGFAVSKFLLMQSKLNPTGSVYSVLKEFSLV
jgi:2'-5' RNA ligase